MAPHKLEMLLLIYILDVTRQDTHLTVAQVLQGRWYITAGLNPLFDTFDCQACPGLRVQSMHLGCMFITTSRSAKSGLTHRCAQEHFFANPSPRTLYAKINWRVPKQIGNDFIERSDVQKFVQVAIVCSHMHIRHD